MSCNCFNVWKHTHTHGVKLQFLFKVCVSWCSSLSIIPVLQRWRARWRARYSPLVWWVNLWPLEYLITWHSAPAKCCCFCCSPEIGWTGKIKIPVKLCHSVRWPHLHRHNLRLEIKTKLERWIPKSPAKPGSNYLCFSGQGERLDESSKLPLLAGFFLFGLWRYTSGGILPNCNKVSGTFCGNLGQIRSCLRVSTSGHVAFFTVYLEQIIRTAWNLLLMGGWESARVAQKCWKDWLLMTVRGLFSTQQILACYGGPLASLISVARLCSEPEADQPAHRPLAGGGVSYSKDGGKKKKTTKNAGKKTTAGNN